MRPRVGTLPDAPPGVGPNGRPFCRGCWQEVTGRRQSWCSQACVDEAMIHAFPSIARRHVEARDGGVCATCGSDAALTARVLERLWRRPDDDGFRNVWKDENAQEAVRLIYRAWGFARWTKWDGTSKHLWEADHETPVVEGGGGCGLENYRTLCIPCHREATRALRRRLSLARKASV